MQIKIKKTSPLAKTPTYATDGSGCFDLYAINTLATLVHEGYPVTFDTGLAFEIPQGYGMFILSRSGHGFNFDTRLANCVGFIDSDYRGEVKVKLTCDKEHEEAMPMAVKAGDRRLRQAVEDAQGLVQGVHDGRDRRGDVCAGKKLRNVAARAEALAGPPEQDRADTVPLRNRLDA